MSKLTEGPWEVSHRNRVIATRTGHLVCTAMEEEDAVEIVHMRTRIAALEEVCTKFREQEKRDSLYRSKLEVENAALRAKLESTNVTKQSRRTVDEAEVKKP